MPALPIHRGVPLLIMRVLPIEGRGDRLIETNGEALYSLSNSIVYTSDVQVKMEIHKPP